MSGGSYGYAHRKLEAMATDLREQHASESHVLALADHLDGLGQLMRAIEWADSGDTSWDAELDAQIRAAVSRPSTDARDHAPHAQDAAELLALARSAGSDGWYRAADLTGLPADRHFMAACSPERLRPLLTAVLDAAAHEAGPR